MCVYIYIYIYIYLFTRVYQDTEIQNTWKTHVSNIYSCVCIYIEIYIYILSGFVGTFRFSRAIVGTGQLATQSVLTTMPNPVFRRCRRDEAAPFKLTLALVPTRTKSNVHAPLRSASD